MASLDVISKKGGVITATAESMNTRSLEGKGAGKQVKKLTYTTAHQLQFFIQATCSGNDRCSTYSGNLEEWPPNTCTAFQRLSCFKYVLQVAFCEGVRHRLPFCLYRYHKCAKMKQKSRRGPSQANRVGVGRQSCCFWSKLPDEKHV
jgi:hypothetical protein